MATPSNMPLTPDDSTRFSENDAVQRVLKIAELLARILDYVVHFKKQLITDNVKCCRLVNTEWLKATSGVLLCCGQPLFQLCTPAADSPQPIEGTQLHQFLTSIQEGHLDGHVAPHSMQSSVKFFHEENYAFFLEYFRTCGSGLIELQLECNKYPYPQLPDANIKFPKLQKFRMYLDWSAGFAVCNADKINFIQSVFTASQQLKSFVFSWRRFVIHPNFRDLIFPTALTEIELECYLSDSSLEVLLKNPLSNLKTLKLCVTEFPFRDGLITSILEHVRKTLVNFHVGQLDRRTFVQDKVTRFTFPLMEKLKMFENAATNLELAETLPFLEQCIPQLNHMALENQSIYAFLKWTEHSSFNSVTRLSVSLCSPEERQNHATSPGLNFELATMESLKMGFPNLQELHLSMYDLDKTAVLFIMAEMKFLKHLGVNCCGEDEAVDEIVDTEFWNALLIGLPPEDVAALKKDADLWEGLKNQSTVSIRNLTELHTLEVTFNVNDTVFEISSAFHFAFLLMPKLTNLIFHGDYLVPRDLIKEWRRLGRSIEMDDWDSDSGSESEDSRLEEDEYSGSGSEDGEESEEEFMNE